MSRPVVLRRYNPADNSTVDGHVFRGRLRGGDAGVIQAIHIMRQLVTGTAFPGREYANEGAHNPQIQALAQAIVAGIAPADRWAQANAVFQWVKQNIEFRGEVDELIQSPVKTVKVKVGDCDDHSTLLAALLMPLGFQVRFNTVAADKSQPQQFTHVYAEVFIPGAGWTPADTTVPTSVLGWRAQNVTRSKDWGALGSLARSLEGLGDGIVSTGGGSGSDLSSTVQDWLAILNSPTVASALDPLAQAAANRIQFGQVTPILTGTTGFQIPGQTVPGAVGLPGPLVYLGIAAFAGVLLLEFAGRRR